MSKYTPWTMLVGAAFALVISLVAIVSLVSLMSVEAVHDDGIFELEGNIVDSPPGPPPDWGSRAFPRKTTCRTFMLGPRWSTVT